MSNSNLPPNQQPEHAVVHPPAAPEENHDLQEEDFQNMEEIERELAKAMGGSVDDDEDDFDDDEGMGFPANSKSISQSVDYLPAGAVPTVNGKLSSHASEFWFPESRDCKCCKGFKYGCPCTKSGFLCCQEGGCVEASNVGKRAASITISVPPPHTSNNHGAPSGGKSLPSPSGTGGASFCKFEFSPAGCRFGNTCRFVHQGVNNSGSPRASDGRAFCPYFMKGNCDFGDKCRYAHI